MKAVLVLLDSLNRHMLPCYDAESDVIAPNMTAFAAGSCIYDNHFIGSAPCIPARRDLMTGRMNFLERTWGPIEPFDTTLPDLLRKNGVQSHMVTDHYHYAELGGEGYMQLFDTWELIRGQENDPWISQIAGPEPVEHIGKIKDHFLVNRNEFTCEEEHPTPMTFRKANEWVERNKGTDDWFLMVEGFDPHEPFYCPQEYVDMYGDRYEGPEFWWPEYEPCDNLTEEQLRHIRNCYKGTVSMADKWFGSFIGKLKENGMYDDTLIILTSDHGFLLGEHGFMAKNYMHVYDQLAHIPLIVHWPESMGMGDRRCGDLTQATDIMPTFLRHYGIDVPESVTGFPLQEGETRDAVIYGYHGKACNICDGEHTYFRAPDPEVPIYEYTCMPTGFKRYLAPALDCGRYLRYTDRNVFRCPVKQGPKALKYVSEDMLFDYRNDEPQEHPLHDERIEKEMRAKMRRLMEREGSPDEMYRRFRLDEEA